MRKERSKRSKSVRPVTSVYKKIVPLLRARVVSLQPVHVPPQQHGGEVHTPHHLLASGRNHSLTTENIENIKNIENIQKSPESRYNIYHEIKQTKNITNKKYNHFRQKKHQAKKALLLVKNCNVFYINSVKFSQPIIFTI